MTARSDDTGPPKVECGAMLGLGSGHNKSCGARRRSGRGGGGAHRGAPNRAHYRKSGQLCGHRTHQRVTRKVHEDVDTWI
jgi:hypothetical protein